MFLFKILFVKDASSEEEEESDESDQDSEDSYDSDHYDDNEEDEDNEADEVEEQATDEGNRGDEVVESEDEDNSDDSYIKFDKARIHPKKVTSFRILLDALNNPNCSNHMVQAKITITNHTFLFITIFFYFP